MAATNNSLIIVDAGGGNIASIVNCLARVGIAAKLSRDPEEIARAEKIIIPGVGHAGHCMQRLHDLGLIPVLKAFPGPVLGICVGMQLLFEHSEEGDAACLGFLSGKIVKMAPGAQFPVPHMGWNALEFETKECQLLKGIAVDDFVYFANSFYAPVAENTLAFCRYGNLAMSAIVNKGRYWGVQFHPEKSQEIGMRILKNFGELAL
jgi:glutamine amidotransferase